MSPLGELLGVGNFNEVSGGYIGLVALLLAVLAVARDVRRGVDRFFLVLAAAAAAVAYSVPPVVNLVSALPLFRVSTNSRAVLLVAFGL